MHRNRIEEVIEELHEVRPEILSDRSRELFYAIMSIADQRDDYKERMKKAVDKLYCWGEALEPVFQKEMLEILKVEDGEQ